MNKDQDNKEPPYEQQFRCLAPEADESIYDYLIGELKGNALLHFEAHLLVCLACQAELATLMAIVSNLRKNPRLYFPKSGQRATAEGASENNE
jgi:hypothetical protein